MFALVPVNQTALIPFDRRTLLELTPQCGSMLTYSETTHYTTHDIPLVCLISICNKGLPKPG